MRQSTLILCALLAVSASAFGQRLWETTAGIDDGSGQRPTQFSSPAGIFRAVSQSIVVVESKDGRRQSQGSGVAIGHILLNGSSSKVPLFVTNAHVVAGATEAITVRRGQQISSAKLIYLDSLIDVALLAAGSGLSTPPVSIGDPSKLEVGDPLFAVGSPLGLENTLSAGILSGRRTKNGIDYLQTTAPISPGSSGGGLFDNRAKLVGITTSKVRGGENLNLAINSEVIYHLRGAIEALRLLGVLANEKERQTLENFHDRGDVVRWLWSTRDPTSGLRTYAKADRDIDRAHTNSQDRHQALRAVFAGLFERLTEDIDRFPLASGVADSSIVVYHCRMEPDGMHLEFSLDEENGTVNHGSELAGKYSRSMVEWTNTIRGVSHLFSFDRVNGRLSVSSLQKTPSFALGEVWLRAQCSRR